jgi:uncharacterized protein YndB with AHSA1/START domain
MLEPLQLSFEVECSAAHAFDTWTNRIATWWPRSHTVSAEPDAQITLEPRVGGRIFERTRSGDEHDWGEVIAFEPPHRLAYLWHIRRDRADATEVEINFRALSEALTRVEIEHRGWERLGDDAPAWRERNVRAWASLLPAFEAALSSPAH